MTTLNTAQKEAVEYKAGPLLIVAGAGTGKTTVIAKRIAYLIENDLAKPEEILAVTFTEKATAEMDDRVSRLLSAGTFDLWISTFHGLAQRILEAHALDIGIPNNFKLLDEVSCWLLVRKNFSKFKLNYYRPLGNPSRFIHDLIKHFHRCKDELIDPANYLSYVENLKLNTDSADFVKNDDDEEGLDLERLSEVADSYHVYNQLLLENGVLDFADLLFYAVKLFKSRPNILKKYQQRFKYILVDEFQDTNWAQYELIKLLAGPDKKTNLTVVGDDDQSIYKFRGASVSNIMQFKTDFPEAKEVVLTENYRSSQLILDHAYNFIQLNNPDRLEAKLRIEKKLIAAKEEKKGEVSLLYGRSASEEAEILVQKIQELKSADASLKWSDFAILCRANHFAEQFAPALLRRNIPYQFLSAVGLYRERVILDSAALLKLVDNYHESTAVYRLLISPPVNLNHEDLSKILHLSQRQSTSLYEAVKRTDEGLVKISEEGITAIKKLLTIIAKCSEIAKNSPVSRVLYTFWEDSGYLKILSDNVEKYSKDIFYLQSFFTKIAEFEKENMDRTVRAWLGYYNFIVEAGALGEAPEEINNDGGEAVKLMTVHAAKGLEFAYVFIPNLVDQRFPSVKRHEAIELPEALIRESSLPEGDAHLEEERRLFYVALTRAKYGVFLSAAKSYGGARDKKLSRFILELEKTNCREFAKEAVSLPGEISIKAPEQEKNQPNNLEIPDTFSFSQLQAYQKCPRQYYYQFVLRIPTLGKGTMNYGKTIHNSLQKFYAKLIELNSFKQDDLFSPVELSKEPKIKVPSLEELLQIYKESWQDDWYYSAEQKKEYYSKGLEALKEFYKKEEANGWTIPLSLENGFHLKMGDIYLKGTIDRIDKKIDGKIKIIDYKTGKPKEKLTFEDKFQLLIYQLAGRGVFEIRNLGEVGELVYYYIDNNTEQPFLGKEEEMEKAEAKILDLAGLIKSQNFAATPGKEVCNFCDFKEICDFRS